MRVGRHRGHPTAGPPVVARPRRAVRAIAFDMDGTLVDLDSAVRGALAAVVEELPRLAPTYPAITAQDLNAATDAAWADMPTAPWSAIRRAGFERALGHTGDGVADRMCETFFGHRYPMTRPFNDVPSILNLLRESYVVGVGSNGNSYPERCGLGGEFDFQVFAHLDGVPPKPSRRFYERVAQAAGFCAEDVVFVGDSLTDDVYAAQEAGMRAIWVNRGGRTLPPDVYPDGIITALDQLPAALATLTT